MAWFDEFNLPGATIDGYFGFIRADGSDEDDYPDVILANGTVTFTATTEAARIDGAWLGIQSVTAQIFEGQIVISEEDPRPVRLLATDAPIGVADWAWRASFRVPGFQLNPLTFRAPRDTTVNLTADLIPIKSQPYQIIEGASIVDAEVDGDGKMRFEMSDGSFTKWVDIPNGEQGIQGERGPKGDAGKDGTAATLAMGTVATGATADAWMTGTATDKQLNLTLPKGPKGDKGADAVQPTVEWDGTVLKVDGKSSPDLKGTSGIASVTSPRDGVWMIDQAAEGDSEALADLQAAVADKATRDELAALGDAVDEKLGPDDKAALSASIQAKANTSTTDALSAQIAALPTIASGFVTVTPTAANATSSAEVNFPRPFAAPPSVTATAYSGAPTTVTQVTVSNVTATGCTVYMYRTSTTATNIMWIAVSE